MAVKLAASKMELPVEQVIAFITNHQWVKIFTIFVRIFLELFEFSVTKTDLPGYDTLRRLTRRGVI